MIHSLTLAAASQQLPWWMWFVMIPTALLALVIQGALSKALFGPPKYSRPRRRRRRK